MAIGRISGSVLKSNLTRNGVDLAFETSLLYLDVTNSRVGIGTSEPSTALHVVGNTTITGNLYLSGSFSPDTISVNNLYSTDSTAIQINDAVNISGTLTASTFVTNDISSSDSSAVQINDGLNVSGTFTAGNMVTNEISSSDSSAIQINDSVNISGNLSVDTMDVNALTSSDSSQLIVTDNFRVDGYLQANQLIGDIATLGAIASPVNGSQSVNFQLASTADIWIDNTSSIDFTSGSVGARKVIIIHNTAGSNKTVTIQCDGVTKATVTIAAGAANVYELFAISSADKYVVDVGTLI